MLSHRDKHCRERRTGLSEQAPPRLAATGAAQGPLRGQRQTEEAACEELEEALGQVASRGARPAGGGGASGAELPALRSLTQASVSLNHLLRPYNFPQSKTFHRDRRTNDINMGGRGSALKSPAAPPHRPLHFVTCRSPSPPQSAGHVQERLQAGPRGPECPPTCSSHSDGGDKHVRK